MSDSKKKFDLPSLQSIVDGFKGIINPDGSIPDPDPSDALGMQLAKLSVLAGSLEEFHEDVCREMTDQLKEVTALVGSIYTNVQALREGADNSSDEQ